MSRRLVLLTAIITLIGPGAAAAQSPSDALQRQWAEQFLTAYADGSPGALESFCDLYAIPDGTTATAARSFCAGYLYRFRLRYGPVTVRSIESRRAGPMYWLEGDVSHAVWGITFIPTDSAAPKIDGAMVMQGVYPDGFPPSPPVSWSDAPSWLERYFARSAAAGVFSGSVLVARGDQILFHRAYGQADIQSGAPNTTATRFRIASTGKILTALAVLALADRNRLDLDAPISRYYPAYPAAVASQLTARHLLNHTSGLELDDFEPFAQAVTEARGLDDILAAQIRYIEHLNEGRYVNFKPLGAFDYSNEDFDLLGGLLQQVERQPWDRVVTDLVLKPAGANSIAFVRPTSDVARGYTTREEQGWGYVLRDATAELRPTARPAGSQYATAEDLYRVFRLAESRRKQSRTVEAATRQQVVVDDTTAVKLGYGLGFETEQHPCFRSYGHSGVEAGVSAIARHYPDQDVTIIILANRDGVAVDAISYLERSLLACPAG